MHRHPILSAWTVLVLTCGAANPAGAQDAPVKAQDAPAKPAPDEQRQIIVIGDRAIIASLKDAPVEQVYDEDRAASYGASTVGELLGQIKAENGDTEPVILINGQPAPDAGDIADFPVEAVSKIETLPRGTAAVVGGGAGQRAYNIVLKSQVRSLTFTAARQIATEGDWGTTRGEAIATWIKGQDRVNLTLRASESDPLFEADRGVIAAPQSIAFAPLGNVLPASGTQVDPAFSALVGRPVGIIALPAGNTRPTLASLVPFADQTNPNQLSAFRTLRGASRPIDLSLSANKELTPWLALAVNGRIGWIRSQSQSGLPSARFLVGSTNAFTPFSTPVVLALSDPARPLHSLTEATNGSFSATFNANWGDWHAALFGRYESRERTSDSDRLGTIAGGSIAVQPAVNPFDGTLAGQIPVVVRSTYSRTINRHVGADIDGPLFELPAGKVRIRAGAAAARTAFESSDSTGAAQSVDRNETTLKAGISIPLTDRVKFLPWLGDSELSFDVGRLDLGRFGRIDRHSIALNWSPLEWLRLNANEAKDGVALPPELAGAPVIVTENVPYFDPISGETVNVTTISGGAANLDNQEQRTRTLSLTASPYKPYNLQLNADYVVTDLTNLTGALPPPSSAVVAAFPDRFQRDVNGRLVLVDNRTVNFARQHSRSLRLGGSFSLPLSQVVAPSVAIAGQPRRRPLPRTTLQVNAAHTILLENTTTIRAGLPEVDLLQGGAIGIGGGQQRHSTDLGLALTRGGTGVRAQATWRGESFLQIGTLAAPDLLAFEPVFKLDLRVFADLGQLLPGTSLAKGTRVQISFENLTNNRQLVRNLAGITPLGYQPAYRDPIGRTVSFELRKVF
ncbi:MAG: hypothetical protein ACREBO_08520 [Novosphingobium sp.]